MTSRRTALAQAAAIAVTQVGLLRGFRSVLDVNLTDESTYLRQGLALAGGRFEAIDYSWSLPLTALYAVLHQLPDVGLILPDLLYAGLAVGCPLLLWWALRAIVPSSVATLVALLLGSSTQLLATERAIANTSSYAFGFALLTLGLGLLARGRWRWAAGVAVLAALHRIELGAVFGATGLLLIVHAARGRRLDRPGLALLLAGGGVAQLLRSSGAGSERVWLTFRQHFALGLAERQGLAPSASGGPTAFDEPGPWMAQAFPSAGSIPAAARENPGEFVAHLRHGLERLPAELERLSHLAHLPPTAAGALTAASLAGAAVVTARSRRRADPVAPGLPRGVVHFALATLLVLATAPLLRPRTDVLMPLLLGAAVPVALAWSALQRNLPPAPRIRRVALAASLVAIALHAWLGPRAHPERPNRTTPNRAAVELLREYAPGHGLRVLAPLGNVLLDNARRHYHVRLDTTERRFLDLHAGRPATELFTELEPDLIVVHPHLRQNAEQFPGLIEELKSDRWTPVEYREGTVLVAPSSSPAAAGREGRESAADR